MITEYLYQSKGDKKNLTYVPMIRSDEKYLKHYLSSRLSGFKYKTIGFSLAGIFSLSDSSQKFNAEVKHESDSYNAALNAYHFTGDKSSENNRLPYRFLLTFSLSWYL